MPILNSVQYDAKDLSDDQYLARLVLLGMVTM